MKHDSCFLALRTIYRRISLPLSLSSCTVLYSSFSVRKGGGSHAYPLTLLEIHAIKIQSWELPITGMK